MANIARLGVLLGLDSAEFIKGIDAANKKLYDFGISAAKHGAAAATATAAAFVTAAYKAMEFADGIADVAKANDLAIDSVLKLTNALENNGGKAENAGKMISSFSGFVDKAATGSFEAQQAFKKVGISLDDLGKMSTKDLLAKTIEGISKIQDPLTRNAKAVDVFGKAAKGVDFIGFAEGMQSASDATERQANAIKDAAEAYDLLKQNGRDLMLLVTTEVGPGLLSTIKYFNELSSSGTFIKDVISAAFKTIAYQAASFAHEIKDLISVFGAWRDVLVSISKINIFSTKEERGEPARIIAARYADRAANEARLEKLRQELEHPTNYRGRGFADPRIVGSVDTQQRSVKEGLSTEAERLKQQRLSLIKKGEEIEERERAEGQKARAEQDNLYARGNVAMLSRQDIQTKTIDIAQELFKLEQNGVNLRAEDLQLEKDLFDIRNRHEDNMKEIRDSNVLDQQAREDAIKRENDLMEKSLAMARERNALVKQARVGTFGEGFMMGIDRVLRDADTELERGKKAFESVFASMETALDNFVKTGKLSFKDFARSIIQDLIAIQLKASARSLFGGFMQSLMGGGITESPLSVPVGTLAYADGGSPPVGVPSLVGERGPELFIPRTAGTIIPNHAMAKVGSTTNVTNYNIQAIDTKSFEDRILGSSKAVWAANAYGAKNLALGRGRT